MNLFIYEYFASGRVNDQDDLKQAGFAMLDAVLQDFAGVPGLRLITLLDSSLRDKVPDGAYGQGLDIKWNKPGIGKYDQFTEILNECDCVLIIAPESAGIIAVLTAIVEQSGKKVLGSPACTLKLVCNKANLLELFKNSGLPVPRSQILQNLLPEDAGLKIPADFALPLVIKPVYGAGGEGIRLIQTYDELDKVRQQLRARPGEQFFVQEFIAGQAVSVSCFVSNGRALPLSLNKQIIHSWNELIFRGITVPFGHARAQEILTTAVKACELVEGLEGFVGIDLVVNAQGPVLMEINARITLAYVALRKVISRNLAGDLLTLCLEQKFPDRPEFNGTYTYLIS